MTRYSDDAIEALKLRNPVSAEAGRTVRLRAGASSKFGGRDGFRGPCPICSRNSADKSDSRFECDADHWACAACADGGDVIRLVMKRDGIDFAAAVAQLGGVADAAPTPEMARRRGRQDRRAGVAGDDPLNIPPQFDSDALCDAWREGWLAEDRAIAAAVRYRERERERLYRFWRVAVAWPGTPVETYLAGRGLLVPPGAQLRFHPDMILFADGREDEPRMLHRGPAKLAAIIGPDGRFSGLHTTWLDPAGPKGKALVIDPETGEAAPSKKSRGHKQGGYIELGGCPAALASRMVSGEGNETVLSVYTALLRAGRDLSRTNFRGAVDIGNLAGKAVVTVVHPTLKDRAGRARRVPNDEPDMASEAMPVPDNIDELILLGDGDSDPFTTRMALARAAKRHQRAAPTDGAPPGASEPSSPRLVRVRFALDGLDFNDMLLSGDRSDRS